MLKRKSPSRPLPMPTPQPKGSPNDNPLGNLKTIKPVKVDSLIQALTPTRGDGASGHTPASQPNPRSK